MVSGSATRRDNRTVASVRVRQAVPGTVHEALSCWCDVGGWAEWVDGLARVLAVEGDWPQEGSSVTWESVPAGRGQVRERVLDYVPHERLVVFIEDSLMQGTQTVGFEPAPGGVTVELSLSYRVRRRSPLTPVVEWLFIRRPMTASVSRTLERFTWVLEASRGASLG
jgi:hypothetical protein